MRRAFFHTLGKCKDNQYTTLPPRFTFEWNSKIINRNKSQRNCLRKGDKNTIEVLKKKKLDRVVGL